jgi:hypothetical protein
MGSCYVVQAGLDLIILSELFQYRDYRCTLSCLIPFYLLICIKVSYKLFVGAHAYNLSYLRGRDQKDCS